MSSMSRERNNFVEKVLKLSINIIFHEGSTKPVQSFSPNSCEQFDIVIFSSVVEPPDFWAAPAGSGSPRSEPTQALTKLGRSIGATAQAPRKKRLRADLISAPATETKMCHFFALEKLIINIIMFKSS